MPPAAKNIIRRRASGAVLFIRCDFTLEQIGEVYGCVSSAISRDKTVGGWPGRLTKTVGEIYTTRFSFYCGLRTKQHQEESGTPAAYLTQFAPGIEVDTVERERLLTMLEKMLELHNSPLRDHLRWQSFLATGGHNTLWGKGGIPTSLKDMEEQFRLHIEFEMEQEQAAEAEAARHAVTGGSKGSESANPHSPPSSSGPEFSRRESHKEEPVRKRDMLLAVMEYAGQRLLYHGKNALSRLGITIGRTW